jgi:peptidoglycan/xylan/chitin deacetylase (PgdA/CDA1 family)
MLSWEDLRGLMRRGLGVGCHTMTHPILTRISESECEYEIQGSLDVLEAKLNSRVCHFAYPNGTAEDYSPAVRNLVRSAGFRSACTTENGTNRLSQNLWELNRIDGNCGSVWELAQSMTGVAEQ